ncbi:MAG: aldo/keto reductase [Gammaproteobacteria bacterium]|nr:aldo/keto reductase [Gammaproteobacteria bacterium]
MSAQLENTTPRTFALAGDLTINRLGYGAMRLTGQPGNFGPYPDWAGGVALLRRAAELGVDFFDSAWSYGPETADQIVGDALGDRPVVIATKGGVDKPEAGRMVVDGSRDALHRQIDGALRNLRRDRIDLFQLHRVDPATPIETSVAALADGRIRHIGLSNVTRDELDRALAVAAIASVQNRFNLSEQADSELVDHTAERGIAFIPYGPLGAHPLQHGARLDPGEALAWLLQRSPNTIVIPGTTSIAHLEQNVRAWQHI